MNKENLKTTTIIILVLIIVGLVGFLAYNLIYAKAYQDGVIDTNQRILDLLDQNGYVPFKYIVGNETKTINLIPYQQT